MENIWILIAIIDIVAALTVIGGYAYREEDINPEGYDRD